MKRSGGSFNSSDTVLAVLEKAAPQLHPNHPNIVVLSDDTEVTLFIDTNAQFAVRDSFHGVDGNKMSAVVLLGNCTHQEMYKMSYIVNPDVNHPVDERMFAGFPAFQEQWAEMHLL